MIPLYIYCESSFTLELELSIYGSLTPLDKDSFFGLRSKILFFILGVLIVFIMVGVLIGDLIIIGLGRYGEANDKRL